MNAAIFSFTQRGEKLAESLLGKFDKTTYFASRKPSDIENISDFDALIFIGATGIAVRYCMPVIKDKLIDPAVIVIDEMAQFVIPLLSGHVGGANELAIKLANELNAIPVITTATDINGTVAIDVLAANNNLAIRNRNNIKRVSSSLLKGGMINMAIADDVVITSDDNDIDDEVLGLMYRPIVVGMGCRKGKEFEALEEFFLNTINSNNIDIKHILAIASIDIKADEPGLKQLAQKYGIRFITYSSDELKAVEGDFEESSFVENTVGVSDVSARAAKACGVRGHFIVKKLKQDGMTISVFEKYRRITFNYEEN